MNDTGAEQSRKSGVLDDLLEVFWAPTNVFGRTRERSAWKYIGVLVAVGLVIVIATGSLIRPYLEADINMRMSVAAAQSGQQIPENAVAAAQKFAMIAYYFSPLLAFPLLALVSAIFVLLAGKTMSAPVRYGQALTIVALSSAPRLLGYLSAAAQGAVLDSNNARSVADTLLGPARFMDPQTTSPLLFSFLSTIDVFTLWQYVLIAIGVSVVARVERSTGAVAALMAWVLGAALTLIPGLLAS